MTYLCAYYVISMLNIINPTSVKGFSSLYKSRSQSLRNECNERRINIGKEVLRLTMDSLDKEIMLRRLCFGRPNAAAMLISRRHLLPKDYPYGTG